MELKKKNSNSLVIFKHKNTLKKPTIIFKKKKEEGILRDDINLLELDWSVRTQNVLTNNDLRLLSDLIQYTEKVDGSPKLWEKKLK